VRDSRAADDQSGAPVDRGVVNPARRVVLGVLREDQLPTKTRAELLKGGFGEHGHLLQTLCSFAELATRAAAIAVPGPQFLRNRLADRLDRIASGNMPTSATGASPDGQGTTPPRRWTGIGTWRIRNGAEEGAMTTEALVIDCDGHILEPPDLWETYLEPAYRDRALRIRVGDDGFEYLEIDGQRSTIARH